jgi:uncharacterized metal-binding protein
MSYANNQRRVLVIPCSGIGKVQGLISREAAYMVTDELAQGLADTLCLALLVKGDAEAVANVRSNACITIDGCGKSCARKSVEMAGGQLGASLQVAQFFKAHRGAQPGSAAALAPDGWTIVQDIAETVRSEVMRCSAPDLSFSEEVAQ